MGELHQVYLSFGANLGDRLGNLEQALWNISAYGTIDKISACYETKPVGYAEQPDFLNFACRMETPLSPQDLLRNIKYIEEQMGRQASFRNAPRPIDIDILLSEDIVMNTADLAIPHPRMLERAFVLAPLADIAPEIVPPGQSYSISELLQQTDRKGIQRFPQALRWNPIAVESYYLETQEDLFFAVKGLEHPADRIIAVLRYAPDPGNGARSKNGKRYRRLYHLEEQEEFLSSRYPEYFAYDSVFQASLQSAPRSRIQRIYDPRLRLQELRYTPGIHGIESDAVAFAQLLSESAEVPWFALGITGSLLIGLQTQDSDLDMVVQGTQYSVRIHRALQSLLDDPSCAELKRLDAEGLREIYLQRNADTPMKFDEFVSLEEIKVQQGRFRGRPYFIRFLKDGNQSGETYGDRHYTPLGRLKVRALVADDRDAIFTPCRYLLSDVKILEGPSVSDLKELTSFRGRFCEQAQTGSVVQATGTLERIKSSQGEVWHRLLLGNSLEDSFGITQ
jgi:2-amino-4-hydroxy-6-hydroxymethyldihydropteridine diphosphokinase